MLIPTEMKVIITVYCLTFFVIMIFKDTEGCRNQYQNMVKTEKTVCKAANFVCEFLYQRNRFLDESFTPSFVIKISFKALY